MTETDSSFIRKVMDRYGDEIRGFIAKEVHRQMGQEGDHSVTPRSAEEWESIRLRFSDRIRSLIETAVNEEIARVMANPCPITAFSESDVKNMISQLAPHAMHKTGKDFLLKIVESNGLSGLDDFMQRANSALVRGEPLEDIFKPDEKEIYEQCRPDRSRRRVLIGIATGAGLLLGGHAVSLAGKEVLEMTEEEKEALPECIIDNPLQKRTGKNHGNGNPCLIRNPYAPPPVEPEHGWRAVLKFGVDGMEMAAPVVEMAGAAVIMGYVVQEYHNAKLEQLCEAINGLSKETRNRMMPGSAAASHTQRAEQSKRGWFGWR